LRVALTWESERSLVAEDAGSIVGHTNALTRDLAVPGGVVPAAHVTGVGVAPTHRRRGLLRAMMQRQLGEVAEAGREPIAVLWASETTIYPRFGYGPAASVMGIHAMTRELRAKDTRIYGITICRVVSNMDLSGLGRVQLSVPSLPGYQPWARVAAFSAGSQRGGYFIPQQDDEVLVIFNQGDVTDPFVIGTLWNGRDKPPFTGVMDPTQKRAIHTPAGHELLFDDGQQTIVLKTSTGQKVTLAPDRIELAAGQNAKITMQTSGTIKIEASVQIELQAPTVKATATGSLELKSSGTATLQGASNCAVKGALVNIN